MCEMQEWTFPLHSKQSRNTLTLKGSYSVVGLDKQCRVPIPLQHAGLVLCMETIMNELVVCFEIIGKPWVSC